MNNVMKHPAGATIPPLVPAGEDRFGKFKTLGISSIAVKVSSQESSDLLAVEITLERKGGPEKHVHLYQDEWFYFLEGEFIVEIGDKRFRVKPGDSLFGPRKVPHAWAFAAGTRGRMLASVMPAGKLEAFFTAAAKLHALPGPDPNNWRPYDMEWIGPPLVVE